MTDRELLKMALEALERVKHHDWDEDTREGRALITALRAALAEPVQEPEQEPARRPLTDEEIDALWRKTVDGFKSGTTQMLVRGFARAIERKITGGNDE